MDFFDQVDAYPDLREDLHEDAHAGQTTASKKSSNPAEAPGQWLLKWLTWENDRRLPIVLSVSLICLGLSQWFDPSEFPMRWKWLQDMTNSLLGNHGHAKFLISFGAIWLFWNLFFIFTNSSKEIDWSVAGEQK